MEKQPHPISQELQLLLADRSFLQLPPAIRVEGDLLGLVEHNAPREAFANRIFAGFEDLTRQYIQTKPEARAAFVTRQPVDLPDMHVDMCSYSVRRSYEAECGLTKYEVLRTDIGSDDGGFVLGLFEFDDKSILFRTAAGIEPKPDSDEYLKQLEIAYRFLGVYVSRNNFKKPQNNPGEVAVLEQTLLPSLLEADRHNRRWTQRLRRAGSRTLAAATGQAAKLVTKKVTVQEAGIPVTYRKLAPGRVALLAVLTPLPFLSENVSDSVPIPRPASIDVAEAASAFVFSGGDVDGSTYDIEAYDLPSNAYIAPGNEMDVPALEGTLPVEIIEGAPSVYTINEDDQDVGPSPRVLKVEEVLEPAACTSVAIDEAQQDEQIGVLAMSSSDAADLSVEVSQNRVEICNTSDRAIDFTDRDLYIDAR